MIESITWFDHASFRLDGEKTIYIDPWELPEGQPRADIILISHDHYDHCSPPDVAAVSKSRTVIVTTPDCAKKFKGMRTEVLAPGDAREIDGIPIEALAAYNPEKKFHPQKNSWLGFVLTLRGQRIYYAGDTDLTPEVRAAKADIALLPIGGTYTMGPDEAVEAATAIGPRVVVPYHWGKIVGGQEEADRFAARCPVPVRILPRVAARLRPCAR